MEQESILRYDSVKNGYNISLGGDGVLGVLCSDATKEKIGHANKGKRLSPIPKEALRNWKKEHGSWNRGKSLSGEHLRKITEERQARCNKRILAIDPITNIVVGEFKSCTKAANHFGVTKNTISRCAHGGRPTSCGFVWRYV